MSLPGAPECHCRERLSAHMFLCGSCCSIISCLVVINELLFVFFVLFDFGYCMAAHRYTTCDYRFGIFKLFYWSNTNKS